MIDAALRARVEEWMAGDPDGVTRAELETLLRRDDAGAAGDLADRFAGELEFGTAGLRGPLRAGPNGMNRAVVRRATAGLAAWLLARGDGDRCVIVGRDARHGSEQFARDAAGVLAAAGIPVRHATHPWPTPFTAFAVRHLGAAAGVQVTASHNPANDNGYKVYDGTGAQIVAPTDAEIAAAIATQPRADRIPCDPGSSRVEPIDDEIVGAYYAMADALVPRAARRLRIVYTPVHGVGGVHGLALLTAAGFDAVTPVAAQMRPDPEFPTAPFPNPEEPGVLDHALSLAPRAGADVVLANDPDADRLAIAVPVAGGRARWRRLSGDELGALLADALLRTPDVAGALVARSVVSSRWLDRIAAARGADVAVTLTGFKWLARAADDRSGARLVLAYEEALGYSVTTSVRDKDGLTAALVAAAALDEQPAHERLVALARAHGLFANSQWSARFEGADELAAMRAAIDALRAAPPRALAGHDVVAVIDHRDGGHGLPAADLLELHLANGRVLVRPSGTEPKLKVYLERVVPFAGVDAADYESARANALDALEPLRAAIAATLGLA